MSINLLTDYFLERTQYVKFDECFSAQNQIKLGVPKGSVLGPLLFLIFINDIVTHLNEFILKLFADDTTLLIVGNDLKNVLNNLESALNKLINWCNLNRLDINWDKTKIMFITSKRNIVFPMHISIEESTIEVVDKFKLLGITIDNSLNFVQHIANLKYSINKRIFAIHRLFYLSPKVKQQFFKSFILPYFDYCFTLIIYFPKRSVQKLFNYYNFCLFKMFKIKFNVVRSDDYNLLNNKLSSFNLECFQHRLIKRLTTFIYKIINYKNSPKLLNACLVRRIHS